MGMVEMVALGHVPQYTVGIHGITVMAVTSGNHLVNLPGSHLESHGLDLHAIMDRHVTMTPVTLLMNATGAPRDVKKTLL